MPVIRQGHSKALPPHRLHRNAIGQAAALVNAVIVELEPIEKRFPVLRDHLDRRVLQNVPSNQSDLAAHEFRRCAKESQVFGHDFIRRYNFIRNVRRERVSAVGGSGQRNPVEGIGENLHSSLLGEP